MAKRFVVWCDGSGSWPKLDSEHSPGKGTCKVCGKEVTRTTEGKLRKHTET